ncbi:MAG: type II toxin-antitoxin system VapC family toxin [Leptolyngbyaceae cyanobacterium RU_5_1]|nr:type II toxin-antitoxin system VapC family toxin [Leptolyngbyaceae cyanobacterium RU_5_1]
MHLLDTDTLTHLHAGNSNVAERLRTLEDPIVGTTIITKIELLRGRMDYVFKAAAGTDLLRAQRLLKRTEDLLAQLLIVSFSPKAAEEFDRLRSIRSLGKIGRADLLIASIALANQAVLVTRNLRHFKQISGLVVVNWVD